MPMKITFELSTQGQPLYSVSYGGKEIVADSALGLTLKNGVPLSTGFRVLDIRRTSHDVTYTLVAGRTREGRDRCEELTVELEETGERPRRLNLVFRAYNDGAAFRYVLPEQQNLANVAIVTEDSQFRFLGDHRAWVLELASFTTSNEREFVPMPLLGIRPETIVGPPLLIELGNGLTVAIVESDLVDYAGLHLSRREGGNESRNPVLVTKLAPLPSFPGVAVISRTPMKSPWRGSFFPRKNVST